MSVLGFSHVVTEVEDTNLALSVYRRCGYTLQYVLEQEVPEIKQTILDGRPTGVKVYYLKHNDSPRIGIELIQHDSPHRRTPNDTLVYGHLDSDGSLVAFSNEQQVSRIKVAQKGAREQHIFIPTAMVAETKEFYCEHFYLRESLHSDLHPDYYDGLFPGTKSVSVLELTSTILPAWNALLHIVEIDRQPQARYLNDFGFNCFCFIVNDEELEQYERSHLHVVGPMSAQKTVDGFVNRFEIGFLRDPNGFLVEFYIPRRSVKAQAT